MTERFGDDTRPLSGWSIQERITRWRQLAREEATVAEKAAAGHDHVEATLAAALSTMYLALAVDADRFGELPELDTAERETSVDAAVG